MILDLLLRPGMEGSPDEPSRFLATRIRTILGRRFAIPAVVTCACPHSDELIPAEKRGDWTVDTFPQLVIHAYVLGATRVNLPAPHEQLLPYYRSQAENQKRLIEEAARRYAPLRTEQERLQAERERLREERERLESERQARDRAEQTRKAREERMGADIDALRRRASELNTDPELRDEQIAAIRERYRREEER